MTYVDLHIHLLSGVDDGAKNEAQMQAMLDAAYDDGTRIICATPHFHPGYFGDNRDAVADAFEKLRKYAEKYSDLELYLGNELRYSPDCTNWLQTGVCRTINGTRYLLVDFLENTDADYIVNAMLRLMNAGYIPILAHAERYERFHRDYREIRQLQECGVLIQIDAQSPFGGWGRGAKQRSRRMLTNYYADLVASDAHDTRERPPQLSTCYRYVVDKCGEEYAAQIFRINPENVLNDREIRKDFD